MDRHEHWNSIYQTKSVTDVSWFESKPQVSLELITAASPRLGRVINVGGGASRLVDKLVTIGFESVTALDISQRANLRSLRTYGLLQRHQRNQLGPLVRS